MRNPIVVAMTVALLALLSAPVLAGGWAVVHLDEPPGDVVVDTPWRFGFMVLQHDVTPISEVTATVSAQHMESGEVVNFLATQEGDEGHFEADVVFPRAGEWKWFIQPEPFAETTFETLRVSPSTGIAAPRVASLHAGTCAAGTLLAANGSKALVDDWRVDQPAAGEVATTIATVDAPLAVLSTSEHALTVRESAKDGAAIACGVLTGGAGKEMVVGLQPVDDSGTAGIAVLREAGAQTEATLYLLDLAWKPNVQTFAAKAEIEIVGGNSQAAMFSPVSLTVEPGTLVTWVNTADSAHMISGESLAFADSGWLDSGESFSLIFTEPGEFHYRCGPHPWMTGTVTVAE